MGEVGLFSVCLTEPARYQIIRHVLMLLVCVLWFAGCANSTPPSEIQPEFQKEVDQLYGRFQEGDVLHSRRIPLLNEAVEVFVVDNPRGAEYGFVVLDREVTCFWIVASGRYKVFRYNATHLFVILDEKYCLELERAAGIAASPNNAGSTMRPIEFPCSH